MDGADCMDGVDESTRSALSTMSILSIKAAIGVSARRVEIRKTDLYLSGRFYARG